MLNRNSLQNLIKWKDNPNRKPLLIRGARQVGKTTLIRMFKNQFVNYVELNLEKETEKSIFKNDDIEHIVKAIYLVKNVSPKKGSTLIFIDEIQESPHAIKMLRYFYEERPDLYIIAAGSLLEFALEKVPSFPVGRIDYLYLHPMSFDEYLQGINQNAATEALHNVPVPQYAHHKLLKLFHDYALIGGMPEIVDQYIKSNDVVKLNSLYRKLWESYKDDAVKYGKNQSQQKMIRHIIDSAPYETDRIKFENFGNSNYRSREIGEALRAIHLSKVIQLNYPTTSLKPPIVTNYRKRPRLQFLDTGMLNQILLLQKELIGLEDLSQLHKGKIIQHLICQELISTHCEIEYHPNFWVRENKDANAEVDLVYQYGPYVIPIEMKSGKQGTLKSLHQFVERSNHVYAVRFYAGKFAIERHYTPMGKKPYFLMNLPYYLGTKLSAYLEYFVSNYTSTLSNENEHST